MTVTASSKHLLERANHQCEFCGATEGLSEFEVPLSPKNLDETDATVIVCSTCSSQLNKTAQLDPNHWRCLNDAIWSQTPAVQVISYRMLHLLKNEGWPQDLLDMMYLEDATKSWADAGVMDDDDVEPTKDANGTLLQEGDDVTIIKDLEVKGAGFTAKRGTTVKNIHLVDNPKHIEGKVNGTQVVLVAAFMKKL